MSDFNLPGEKVCSATKRCFTLLVHTEESEPVAEQHCWTQVVDQVQIREGSSGAVIL